MIYLPSHITITAFRLPGSTLYVSYCHLNKTWKASTVLFPTENGFRWESHLIHPPDMDIPNITMREMESAICGFLDRMTGIDPAIPTDGEGPWYRGETTFFGVIFDGERAYKTETTFSVSDHRDLMDVPIRLLPIKELGYRVGDYARPPFHGFWRNEWKHTNVNITRFEMSFRRIGNWTEEHRYWDPTLPPCKINQVLMEWDALDGESPCYGIDRRHYLYDGKHNYYSFAAHSGHTLMRWGSPPFGWWFSTAATSMPTVRYPPPAELLIGKPQNKVDDIVEWILETT